MRDSFDGVQRGQSTLDELARQSEKKGQNNQPKDSYEVAGVDLLSAADMTPEPIRWIWPFYLAQGKLHIIAGAPGCGKTTLALAIGAIITTGGLLPDGTRAPIGDVLIFSAEDDPQDTLLPRLLASGANPSRVLFVAGAYDPDGRRAFDPARDMPLLERAIKGKNIKLLIVDPIVSAVSGDSHKNAEVRRSLQPLVDMAARIDCAVIGISHFSKGTTGRDPVERVTGSIAFGALARLVFACAKNSDTESEYERLFVRGKSNIGPDGGGFAYRLESYTLQEHNILTCRVVFGASLEGAARDILNNAETPDDGEGQGALAEAKGFLSMMLENGPMPSKQIYAEALQCGHSQASLRRAKKELGINAYREGGSGKGKATWFWHLPPKNDLGAQKDLDAQPKKYEHLNKNEHVNPDYDDVEVF